MRVAVFVGRLPVSVREPEGRGLFPLLLHGGTRLLFWMFGRFRSPIPVRRKRYARCAVARRYTASDTAALITSVTQKAFHTPAAPNSRLSRKAAGRITTT